MALPDTDENKSSPNRQRLSREVERKEQRKLRGRREKDGAIWFGLGMIGLVGWAVAIPMILGTALGVWVDHRFQSRYSWTLTGIILGIAAGCLNAWFWVKREIRRGT